MEFFQKQTAYASNASSKRKTKILVVDDDRAICDAIKMLLEDEGYHAMSLSDTSKLYDIKPQDTDLILMDVWIEGQDGRDICRYLKKHANTKNIPIILFSASRDIGWSALKAGADDFMEKPFSMDELLGRVSRQLD